MKHTKIVFVVGTILVSKMGIAQNNAAQNAHASIGTTLSDSKEYWPERKQAPAGAPNVVWILLDDVGYGASSAFGGLIPTPNFDSLADQGLRYTNFHTTAICAPTRAALLTGRNSSRVHEAGFSHKVMSFGFPGWEGRIPSDKGTIAEILKENGYNTFAVGKYGLTPDDDITDAGPFDYWPSGKGFEHFFGFLGSQDDQYKTKLIEDNTNIVPDGRHLNEQITDKAISYIDKQQKAAPNKPFFLYYSPGAVHAPHQVPDKWRDIYKGKFDKGWDWYRTEVFEKQKALGVIPKDAKLPPRNPNIEAWEKLSEKEQKLYARFFEVYAAYLTYTDYEIGRLVQHLKEKNIYDNTIIFLLIGDNGASKEGSDNGDIDQPIFQLRGSKEQVLEHNLANIDKIGKPEGVEVNYPLGWAQATNTPFRYWKQDAHSEGGTHNPLIIHYPKKIKPGLRNQYSFVSDILPTTLDLVGIKAPTKIKNIVQDTIQGVSLVYSLDKPNAPTQHTKQYYYIFGSRSIYKDGWKATFAFSPKSAALFSNYSVEDPKNNKWHLYHLEKDFNELNDLSEQNPDKLKELQALFEKEARRNNLYPLITWDDVLQKALKARLQSANNNETH